MAKFEIEFNEKALEELIQEQVKETAENMEYDIKCPHCQKNFSAKIGLNTCPHCQNSIDLGLDFKF